MSDSTDIQTLATRLRSNNVGQRSEAAREIVQRGAAARVAAADLVRAVADVDEVVRETATSCLEDLGPPTQDLLPELVQLLDSDHPDVAYWAATLIGRVGSDAAGCCQPLIAAMQSTRPLTVRQRAAWALGKLGQAAASAQPALENASRDPDARLARLSQRALQEISSDR